MTVPALPLPGAAWRVGIAVFVGVAAASVLPAQVITPKTVPIHQGEQFGIYPAQWPGMGGVSIALPDTLGDPWSNPAKATRLRVGSIQVMPFTHSATGGGGRTLPVSLLQTGGAVAGGALFSLQEVERRDVWWNLPLSERRASNQYLAGVLARRFGGGLSIGGGLSLADLRGVDGTSTLYAGSDRVRQSGSQVDARLGLTRDYVNGGSLELVAVGYKYNMTHDVHFPQTWLWTPCPCSVVGPCDCPPAVVPDREEHNIDRTNLAGIHAVYLAPKSTSGWRYGYLMTANRLSHPKIPDYRIQNIPRDPGHTDAFNFGFGMMRGLGQSTFGLDVIMEPMWSRTWADAARDTADVNGVTLRQGQHTVDNRFRFSNSRINAGFAQEFPGASDSAVSFGLQAGIGLKSIRYTLDQANHVLRTSRTQNEAWIEWTPTFAVRARSRDFEVSYAVSYTCGPSCMSFGGGVPITADAAPAPEPGVIAAPSAPLTFDGGSSSQHRLTISIHWK